MEFRSRKDAGSFAILGVIIAIFLVVLFAAYKQDSLFNEVLLVTIATTLGIVLIFIHMFISTSYTIENNMLKYRCSIFYNGEISIEKITKIKKDWSPLAGMRPALTFKGLVITYNKYDEIYISPQEEDKFIEEILKINKEINLA